MSEKQKLDPQVEKLLRLIAEARKAQHVPIASNLQKQGD
jgi:predicted metal-dependent phosphotriesterase family hydrolase